MSSDEKIMGNILAAAAAAQPFKPQGGCCNLTDCIEAKRRVDHYERAMRDCLEIWTDEFGYYDVGRILRAALAMKPW